MRMCGLGVCLRRGLLLTCHKCACCRFKYTKDHSKIGLTTEATGVDWVCIGDINRMDSQAKRGGGTACLQDSTLWTAVNSAVFISDSCTTRDTHVPTLQAARHQDSSAAAAQPDAVLLDIDDPLQCDCALNPYVSATPHPSFLRRPPIATCNNDQGWLNETFVCADTAKAKVRFPRSDSDAKFAVLSCSTALVSVTCRHALTTSRTPPQAPEHQRHAGVSRTAAPSHTLPFWMTTWDARKVSPPRTATYAIKLVGSTHNRRARTLTTCKVRACFTVSTIVARVRATSARACRDKPLMKIAMISRVVAACAVAAADTSTWIGIGDTLTLVSITATTQCACCSVACEKAFCTGSAHEHFKSVNDLQLFYSVLP